MARVTVEDCVTRVPNRFELVLFAAHRARGMSAGEEILVDRNNDKNPVVALREIADTRLKPSDVREELIESLQKGADTDDLEEMDLPALGAPAPTARDVFGAPSSVSALDTAANQAANQATNQVANQVANQASAGQNDSMGDMSEDDILAALNVLGGEGDSEKDSDSD